MQEMQAADDWQAMQAAGNTGAGWTEQGQRRVVFGHECLTPSEDGTHIHGQGSSFAAPGLEQNPGARGIETRESSPTTNTRNPHTEPTAAAGMTALPPLQLLSTHDARWQAQGDMATQLLQQWEAQPQVPGAGANYSVHADTGTGAHTSTEHVMRGAQQQGAGKHSCSPTAFRAGASEDNSIPRGNWREYEPQMHPYAMAQGNARYVQARCSRLGTHSII